MNEADERPESREIKNLTADERETTVIATESDELVRIWSAQRKHITRMRKHKAFTLVDEGHHGTTAWAEFTIPAEQWNPASGAKRQVTMSDERKAELAERLKKMREQQ